MKKQVLSLIVLALLIVFACKETATSEQSDSADTADTTKASDEKEAPDYAKFEKYAATLSAWIQAHCDEDLEAMSAMVSDTIKWSPAHYNGNQWLGKEDFMAALKGYHDNYDNIKYVSGITLPNDTAGGVYAGNVYPKETANSNANTLRNYGTWSATHIESGKDIGVKWFGIAGFNDDGKIAMWTEYWDVHGLAAQIAED
ncbi:MAG: nuclear transport factor 2 family protein [Bacteroidia bacterium]|nr:nuclear transport factor 2 family protein [Bacteroidia bacterium]